MEEKALRVLRSCPSPPAPGPWAQPARLLPSQPAGLGRAPLQAACVEPPWCLHFMGPGGLARAASHSTPYALVSIRTIPQSVVLSSLPLGPMAPMTHAFPLWSLALSLFIFCFAAFFSLSAQPQGSAWSLPLQSDSKEGPLPPDALFLASAWSPLPTLAIIWHTD